MTLELSQFDVMDHLWKTLDKTEDGLHIRYTPDDVEQLWWMGFVDTARVEIKEWQAAFEPFRQPDGTFLLSRDQFLSLDRYRYKGEIRIPFDPMLINEGRYTDEGLDMLVEASIAPSCMFTPEELWKFVSDLKKEFRQPEDNLILIKKPAKLKIKALLNRYPSPLRNLEILLDKMLTKEGAALEGQVMQAEAGVAAMQAAREASKFSVKASSRVEEKAAGLKALEKARKGPASGEVEGVAKTELHKIRRSRKGVRG